MKKLTIFLPAVALLCYSCYKPSGVYIPKPETEARQKTVIIYRYDSALFSVNPTNLKQGLEPLASQYYFFLGPDWKDTINLINLALFINDGNIRKLYNIETQKFSDLTALKSELGSAFARYLSYYPDKPWPLVYTYISGLNVEMPVLFTDSAMAIGLDLFLGNEQAIYREGSVPEYKIARMTREHVMPECMKAVALNRVESDPEDESLLNQMITAGKVLYFLDVMFPGMADYLKIGYSQEQFGWCTLNEENIWKFLVGNQLLFSTEPAAASKLLSDGPFTSGFAQESPGRLGAWTGWQIVRAYADHNRDLSLRQIMEAKGAQAILEASRYKPGK